VIRMWVPSKTELTGDCPSVTRRSYCHTFSRPEAAQIAENWDAPLVVPEVPELGACPSNRQGRQGAEENWCSWRSNFESGE
jgi:hypothetical protein